MFHQSFSPPSWSSSIPYTLKYAFLGDSETFPVIISSYLDKNQEGKLLDILSEHKEAKAEP